jgi:antitoxin component YwqK of YwqJK toxin-antitoxin module
MIKKIANLFLIILVYLQVSYCQTESNIQNQKYLFSYIHFTSQGKYINGLKDGKWLDVSDSGVIYVDGSYSKGIPISEWKINYPNGVLRKVKLYDSLGNIVKWTRYDFDKKKLLEIIPDSIITVPTMSLISSLEEHYFDLESIDYPPENIAAEQRQSLAVQGYYSTGYFHYSTYNVVHIADSLMTTKFNGKCLIFYETGNISNQYNYRNGTITDVRQFYYKNGKVNIEDVYVDNKIKRTIKYDEVGNVIKIKEK